MTFKKSKASIKCKQCGATQEFSACGEVYANNSKDISKWDDYHMDVISVTVETFCYNCRYQKAA